MEKTDKYQVQNNTKYVPTLQVTQVTHLLSCGLCTVNSFETVKSRKGKRE